jgi:hypothetical protein
VHPREADAIVVDRYFGHRRSTLTVARRSKAARRAVALAALALIATLGLRPEPAQAQRSAQRLEDLLTRTAAVLDGVVESMGHTYSDEDGPFIVYRLSNVRVLLGTAAPDVPVVSFGGPVPDGGEIHVSDAGIELQVGERYLLFLTNAPWAITPVHIALEITTLDGRERVRDRSWIADLVLKGDDFELPELATVLSRITESLASRKVRLEGATPPRPSGAFWTTPAEAAAEREAARNQPPPEIDHAAMEQLRRSRLPPPPPPPRDFIVRTEAGRRLTELRAEITLFHQDERALPQVTVYASGSDEPGTWMLEVATDAAFIETRTVTLPIRLPPEGHGASVRMLSTVPATTSADETTSFARAVPPSYAASGRVALALRGARLEGAVTDTAPEYAAEFSGPFAVTCIVPIALLPAGNPTRHTTEGVPTHVIDSAFETAPCKPHAGWAGVSRAR